MCFIPILFQIVISNVLQTSFNQCYLIYFFFLTSRDNYLRFFIYFGHMSYTKMEQTPSYDLMVFLGKWEESFWEKINS